MQCEHNASAFGCIATNCLLDWLVEPNCRAMIQTSRLKGPNHALLSDYEWTAIKPMLPDKPRGVPRVNDRRVLNGSSGSCDPERPGATCRTTSPGHHLLQSLRSLATGGQLGQAHERTGWHP